MDATKEERKILFGLGLHLSLVRRRVMSVARKLVFATLAPWTTRFTRFTWASREAILSTKKFTGRPKVALLYKKLIPVRGI